MSDKKRFLERIPVSRRSWICNLFLEPIRGNLAGKSSDPEEIVNRVVGAVAGWMHGQPEGERLDALVAALNGIADDRAAAIDLAKWFIEWERLPHSEKKSHRYDQSRSHVSDWMRGKPPSEKQLMYLKRLGYAGPTPGDMSEASEIIDAMARGHSVGLPRSPQEK